MSQKIVDMAKDQDQEIIIVESSARWLINIAEQNRKERRHVPRESNILRDNSRQNYYGFGVARIVVARITEDDEVFRHHTIKGK